MRYVKMLAALVALQPVASHASTIVSENYQGGVSGWSNSLVSDPGPNGGGFTAFAGRFGGETIERTLALSGTQSTVTFDFDFYRIDSWDGESFNVAVFDGATNAVLYSSTNGYYYGCCSDTIYAGWDDAIVHRNFSFGFGGTSLIVRLGSTLDQPVSDESWGIDNFTVTDDATATAVPEPAMLGLFGLGALGLGLARRRKA